MYLITQYTQHTTQQLLY